MTGCSTHPAVCFVQAASPAELAWETVGGVGYVAPSAAPSLVPAIARTASCAEWRHCGYHLVAQVCTCAVTLSRQTVETAASGRSLILQNQVSQTVMLQHGASQTMILQHRVSQTMMLQHGLSQTVILQHCVSQTVILQHEANHTLVLQHQVARHQRCSMRQAIHWDCRSG